MTVQEYHFMELHHMSSDQLSFQKLTLDKTDLLETYLKQKTGQACNFTIGQLYMWRDYLDTHYAIHNEQLYLHAVSEGVPTIVVPDIPHDSTYFDDGDEYFRKTGQPISYFCYDEADRQMIMDRHPELYCREEVYAYDYIYDYSQFVDYPGKKMAHQRNHVNQFNKMFPDWRIEEINETNLPAVKAFLTVHNSMQDLSDPLALEEADKCMEVLDHPDAYQMKGACLLVQNQIIAYSYGEAVHDTLYDQIEKADTRYPGSYQKMACEFAKLYLDDGIRWINREEDVGDEGIRKSKQSYHPVRMLKKYSIMKAENGRGESGNTGSL